MKSKKEPYFTGRFGLEHEKVIAEGADFHIATLDLGRKSDGPCHFFTTKDNFDPSKHFDYPDQEISWTDNCIVRAYNAEDAVNHYHAAFEQWSAWYDGDKETYLTAPFRDEHGALIFDEEGRQIAEAKSDYACYPPCKDAAEGIVTPELFGFECGLFKDAPGWTVASEREHTALKKLKEDSLHVVDQMAAGLRVVQHFDRVQEFVIRPIAQRLSEVLAKFGHELSDSVQEALGETVCSMDAVLSDVAVQQDLKQAKALMNNSADGPSPQEESESFAGMG